MYRKRIKKEFPLGTFIPTPARVVTIIQLCLAFSLLLWQASQPFMGDLFHIRSKMLLYQDAMGIGTNNLDAPNDRLERNAERFAGLPEKTRVKITENYASLQAQLNSSLSQKIERLLQLFAHGISSFELAWIFFSIVISILILKRIEGARQAAWILPALTILFLLDNQMRGTRVVHPENQLFPSEQEIVQNYLQEPLSTDIFKQREQLLEGWNLYLIKEWMHESPDPDSISFQQQAEGGEFLFNIHRLTVMKPNSLQFFPQKTALGLLCLYVGWNLFYAWFVIKHTYMFT